MKYLLFLTLLFPSIALAVGSGSITKSGQRQLPSVRELILNADHITATDIADWEMILEEGVRYKFTFSIYCSLGSGDLSFNISAKLNGVSVELYQCEFVGVTTVTSKFSSSFVVDGPGLMTFSCGSCSANSKPRGDASGTESVLIVEQFRK